MDPTLCGRLPSASPPLIASFGSHLLAGGALLLLLFCIYIYLPLQNTFGWTASSADQRSSLQASKQEIKSFTWKAILHSGFPPRTWEVSGGWDAGVPHLPSHSLALTGSGSKWRGCRAASSLQSFLVHLVLLVYTPSCLGPPPFLGGLEFTSWSPRWHCGCPNLQLHCFPGQLLLGCKNPFI